MAPVLRSTIGWKNVRRRRCSIAWRRWVSQRHAVDEALVHAVVEHRAAPAAEALGGVHGDVGVAQQHLGGDDPIEVVGDPDAADDLQRAPLEQHRLGQELTDAGADLHRLRRRRNLFQDDGELVATEAGQGVGRPQHPLDAPGQLDEELVPGRVTDAVVDQLEAIQVDVEHGAAVGLAFAAAHALGDAIHQQRPVGQAGEGVVQGVVDQALLGVAPLGDIRERAGDADRCPGRVIGAEPPAQDPAPPAVAVADPVLVLEIRARAGDAAVDLEAQTLEIVGVHDIEPRRHLVRGQLLVAQQRLPALGEVHTPGGEVPIPDPVVGGADGYRVAFLASA